MDLYLQMGFGMMDHVKTMFEKWGGGTCIISPRDMEMKQIEKFCLDIHKIQGKTIIDPQFYEPYSNHDRLINHSFWPDQFKTDNFFSGSGIKDLIDVLWNEYNAKTGSEIFIIPGRFTETIDEDWKRCTDLILNEVSKKDIKIPKYLTLSLSSEVISSDEAVNEIIEYIPDFDVDGFYIVAQHPKDQYLVSNAPWISNLLELCAGIKIYKKKVIVGYSNQQQLSLALAKVDAIATGTWMNVRAFSLDKFDKPEEEQPSRRSTWYYCPQTLSEYQITFLDIAKKTNSLDELKTDSIFESDYTNILFNGAQPTSIEFSEREAFRHYFQCMKRQVFLSTKQSFDGTYLYLNQIFETAGKLSTHFTSKGIRAKNKNFGDVYEDTLAALDVFKTTRGMIYQHKWNSL